MRRPEKAGWPTCTGAAAGHGWDAAKRRGIMTSRYIHITTPGKEKQAARRRRAMELQFDYYGPFGFGAVVARLNEPMFDLTSASPPTAAARARDCHPGLQTVRDRQDQEDEDRVRLRGLRSSPGSTRARGREIEDQMQLFAEEVMPGHRPRVRRQGRLPRRRHHVGARRRWRGGQ